MKIKYFGTAAAEGVPALYCKCEVCRYSRTNKGKNIRTRSQTLIDDTLLIDMPPDTLYHSQHMGLDLSKVTHLLITHNHPDHLHTHSIGVRSAGYVKEPLPPLFIYGSMPSIDLIFDDLRKAGVLDRGTWQLQELHPFISFTAGEYSVIPYKANHAYHTYPLIYDISDKKCRVLYAHDTGFFLDETWSFLEKEKPYFNLVSLDCTMGTVSSNGHFHMNLDDCIKVRERLTGIGCADEDTLFILNHFSHNGNCTYDSMCVNAKEAGFTVSFDGLTIEI